MPIRYRVYWPPVAIEEDVPVIDVHPPHEPIHGWRDFFLHLTTITIGLLIALSLEGSVEWQHHRHLVHEAEASLHVEIKNNATAVQQALDDLHEQDKTLKHDVTVLKYIAKNHKNPDQPTMSVAFHITGLDSVSWQTAQSTGALSYMPYAVTQQYADLYNTQSLLQAAQQQAARDAIISIAPFANYGNDDIPSESDAESIQQKIEILQGQLLLVESLMNSLDGNYKKFLAAHPE